VRILTARWLVLSLTLVLSAAATLKLLPADREAYVGSQACAGCHSEAFAAWKDSQHTKMMRPVAQAGVLVADFSDADPGRRFELSDAVWAIGGKWEQQFMGHDGKSETLLPGVWLQGVGKWDFKGWDGWEVPVPVRRCHGCHTVGLDVKTGHFVEPNIGCESCHGPGGWHAQTLGFGRIHSSSDAQVCGQCHVRGRSPSGEHFFPTGYQPGDVLAEHLAEVEPVSGQSSKEWWGNGYERSRHQEYSAWRTGGHSQSLAHLREGYDGRYGAVTRECLGCHAGEYILAGRRKPGLDDVSQGITCTVCHQSHGALDTPRMTCGDCHGSGAFYHEPARNAEHVACGEDPAIGCVGCHMPKVVTIGGAYQLHTHRPGVVPPKQAQSFDMPNSCQNGVCHADRSLEWAIEAFEKHYPSMRPAQISLLPVGER
jgi:hypothetical protein